MPRSELMSWQAGHRRWSKKYRGKQYTISCRQLGVCETRDASRAAANEWWQRKRSQLDLSHFDTSGSRDAWQSLLESLSYSADTAKRNGDLPKLAAVHVEKSLIGQFQQKLAEFPQLAEPENGLYLPPVRESAAETKRLDMLAVLESRRMRHLAAVAASGRLDAGNIELPTLALAGKRRTLRESIDSFLAEKLGKVNRNKLSAGRYNSLERAVKHFENWLVSRLNKATAEDVQTNEIDGDTLPGYLVYIESETHKRKSTKWSRAHAAGVLAIARQFVHWCYEREHLTQLPRNFESRDLRITVNNGKPKALSIETAKRLLGNDDDNEQIILGEQFKFDRFRLYVLLALNCGMTQVDISDLENQQVDWIGKRIIRKRSKTEDFENVPVVNYPLWPQTFELLCKFRNADHRPTSRVLVNRDGNPLKSETIIEMRDKHGNVVKKLRKSDAIHSLIYREAKLLGISPLPTFKQLRKCGSTTLKGNGESQDIRTEYLGHSFRTMRERYEGESAEFQAKFDSAIAKLGVAFGLVATARTT